MTVCTGVGHGLLVCMAVCTVVRHGLLVCMTVCTGVATDNRVQWPVVVYDSVYRWGWVGGQTTELSYMAHVCV